MTQEKRWLIRYNEVMDFIETNHRNPSKHRIEEHNMLNWVKQQRPAKGQVQKTVDIHPPKTCETPGLVPVS